MNKEKFKILIVLIFIACLTGFMSDIYIPSFFAMEKDLDASLTSIQHSMSAFMIAVATTQILYGALSEIIGRRLTLLIGLSLAILGSFICIFTASFTNLIIGRLIQGAGAGACSCIWRAIFRDIFNSQQIAKYGGYLGTGMVFIIAAAPFLGGYLEAYAGWRISFTVAAIYGLIVFSLIYFILPETNTHRAKDRFNIHFFTHAYKQLLSSRLFMGYSLCVFLTFGAFFSWFVVGPVLCMDYFKLQPEHFGLLNLSLGGTAMSLGTLFNSRCVGRFGQERLLRLGWSLMIFSGISIGILNLLDWETFPLFLLFIFIFLFGVTLIWPNAFSKAFAPFGSIAGYASGLYSAIQLGGGAIFGWAVAFIPEDRPYGLALVFILAALSSLLIFEIAVKKTIHPDRPTT